MGRPVGSGKTGGRVKGTPNKPSMKALALRLAEEGETPLEFMLRTMRTPMPVMLKGQDVEVYQRQCREHLNIQMEMAKASAPYIHPRLQTTTITGDEDAPLKVEVDLIEGARRIAFVLAKAAREL